MKINWKGTVITLVVSTSVIGSSYYLNYINTHTTYDTSKITAAKTDNNSSDIVTEDVNGNIHQVDNDSPFVNDDYMKDKKQDEIKVGDPYQTVLKVMGEPDHKTVTKYADGTSELWVYGNEYIFFDSGWVTSIMN